MSELAEVRIAVDHLRALQQQASLAVDQADPDWQRILVTIRRQISEGIAQLSAAARAWTPPDNLAVDYGQFVTKVGSVRQALAMHQAVWPAVSIDPRDGGFRSSVEQVRTAYDELFATLATLEMKLKAIRTKGTSE
jgi:hypothetical protein